MAFRLIVLLSLCYQISQGSVPIERSGQSSLSKNCESKPCFQGRCEGDKCRCFAGWGGQQCDRCHGRSLLWEESEVITDGPKNYSSLSRCMWLIGRRKEGEGGPLLLRLDFFLTECGWDHVYIYEGHGVLGEQLAAFSGLMSGSELIVPSGKATVYFVSDLAFNMSGFNITFAFGKCIKNCSSNGICERGTCRCNKGYKGAACNSLVCTKGDIGTHAKACSFSGTCGNNLKCICNKNFHGDNCQSPSRFAVFDSVSIDEIIIGASHASVAVGNSSIWVISGTHLANVNFSLVSVFDTVNNTWRMPKTSGSPSPRYDHSLVRYKNKLIVFGGVVNLKNMTSELWSLNLDTLAWTFESPTSSDPDSLPYAVAGHKAHIIGDEMFIFFGYNPLLGFVYRIQKYNLVTKQWSIVDDVGPNLYGRFGHSLISYFHDKKEIILIYGGYAPSLEGGYPRVTDMLIEYTCNSQKCSHRTLSSGFLPVFRHSAALLNEMMIVFGGNNHNESTATGIQRCHSSEVQVYDIGCDTWFTLSTNTQNLLERYGHSSVSLNENIFVIGGFNGTILNDVLKFTPAKCKGLKLPDECRHIREGVRCIYVSNQCQKVQTDVTYAQKFLSVVKNEDSDQRCPAHFRKTKTWCSAGNDCQSCIATEGCGWCELSNECTVIENRCKDGTKPYSETNKCIKESTSIPCTFALECFACKQLSHCSWYLMKDSKWKCISIKEMMIEEEQRLPLVQGTSQALTSFTSTGQNTSCTPSCFTLSDCESCVREQCMWCPTMRRCVRMDAYIISFPHGHCQTWITTANTINNQRACQSDNPDCSLKKNCTECTKVPNCGWCDDGSNTGLGHCLRGSLDKPEDPSLCPVNITSKWYYSDCPACQCNGHSPCTEKKGWVIEQICKNCTDNTIGEHCEQCADGYFGDPLNGGKCEECNCNGQATMCNRYTGDCYCTTKGVTGKNCSKCEQKYFGDPENNQPCYYELTIDFIFTFKLDQEDPKDKYVNQINFFSIPHKRDTDVQFMVICESPKNERAYVNMSINSSLFEGHTGMSKLLMAKTVCDENGIRRTYTANAEPGFFFGTDANTTFLVVIYNFSTPIKIQISFSQSPPINWVLFFVIFAACFVVLLVVAGLLWMIKLRIEVFRRNQRRYDEIEQMASRPFASVRLELTCPRANLLATPISVEPCSNYRVGVFTLAVRLPTGGRQFTPYGTSGLAVASSLCYLTPSLIGVLQAPGNTDAQQNRKAGFKRYMPFMRG